MVPCAHPANVEAIDPAPWSPHKRAMTIATFDDVEAEFDALDDWDDRYRLLIDLGRALPAMPDALKTDATRVRGCASQVWLHTRHDGKVLRFAADSDAAIVKGLVALVLMLADGRPAATIDGHSRDAGRPIDGPARRARPGETFVVEPHARAGFDGGAYR